MIFDYESNSSAFKMDCNSVFQSNCLTAALFEVSEQFNFFGQQSKKHFWEITASDMKSLKEMGAT